MLDVVAPVDVVELGCVLEVESLGDWLVPVVVELADVDDPLSVAPAVEPSPRAVLSPPPVGVAPPPPIIIEVPPVAGALVLAGMVIVTVEVVLVVPMVALVVFAGATRARVRGGRTTTAGAVCSAWSALEYDAAAGAAGGAVR